jgi:hypothetical protein
MGLQRTADIESRFVAYVDGLAGVIGHGDRERPLRDYCTGLVMPCERKSAEPMAAVTAPARVGAQHRLAWLRLATSSSARFGSRQPTYLCERFTTSSHIVKDPHAQFLVREAPAGGATSNAATSSQLGQTDSCCSHKQP